MRPGFLTSVVAVIALAGATPAHAAEKKFRDWTVGVMRGDEGLFAATMNDSGGVFGEFCYASEGTCVWLLTGESGCEEGSKYIVLVNTDTGAAATKVLCFNKPDGKPRYAFASYEEIEGIIDGAKWIGIAFPLKSGRFQVSRFSLAGTGEAVAFMERAMKLLTDEEEEQDTSDELY